MNSGSVLSDNSLPRDSQTEFRQSMESWRKLLKRCGRKPSRKSIHTLRVVTLRLQAAVEYRHNWQKPDAPVSDAVQRWSRQGKKLRCALGQVRQEDVSLDKLARVRSWSVADSGGHPALPKEYLGAVQQIEHRLKRRRDAATKKLVAEIEKRRKRLSRLSRKVEAVLEGFTPEKENAAADRILAMIAEVATEFPALDCENLHGFRKRIKKVRYLAEFFAPFDHSAAQYAAVLKRMTGAVGEWHDWQVLTGEIARAEQGNAAMAGVAEFLQVRAGRSLEQALKLCRQSISRLLKHPANLGNLRSQSARELHDRVPRKPVLKAGAARIPAEAERSVRAS